MNRLIIVLPNGGQWVQEYKTSSTPLPIRSLQFKNQVISTDSRGISTRRDIVIFLEKNIHLEVLNGSGHQTYKLIDATFGDGEPMQTNRDEHLHLIVNALTRYGWRRIST